MPGYAKFFCGLILIVSLAGCGGNSSPGGLDERLSPSVAPGFFPGTSATVPKSPASGTERKGTAFDAFIESPTNKEKVAISVFEPTTMIGGQKYPLLINSHGWAGSRTKAESKQIFQTYLDAGYGVITFDQRGWGESGGTIRGMDPDFDGPNMVAVLDWAEGNLDWLAYGLGPDGGDSQNLVLGSFGGSYGGMFQMLLYNIDPKKRLDAMQIQIAPNSIKDSIFPSGVPKTIWRTGLLATSLQGGRPDPLLIDTLSSNRLNVERQEFLDYHGHAFYCESLPVSTNGGVGTVPRRTIGNNYPIDVVILQGARDTLFDLTQGIKNYECFKKYGGDVRFLSMQAGHNTIPVVPDPGTTLYNPLYTDGAPTELPLLPPGLLPFTLQIPGNQNDSRCGTIDVNGPRLQVKFFDEHLKGLTDSAFEIPKTPCLSISSGDAVLVQAIKSVRTGGLKETPIPATVIPSGLLLDTPIAIDLGIVGESGTTVIGGVPHVELQIQSLLPMPIPPTLFVGLGQSRLGVPGVWDLVNNQVKPITGTGPINLDLVAVTARLAKGERLALLVFGMQNQFADSILGGALPQPVQIRGKAFIPVLKPDEFSEIKS